MTMEPMKFVELAKDHDSFGRKELTGIYREQDRLVATDGHRLHYVGGLPVVEKGHFLDGRDNEFPNYEVVFLKNPVTVGTIKLSKKTIRDLTALSKVVREKNCATKVTIDRDKNLTFECEYKNETGGGTWVYTTKTCGEIERAWSAKLNLRYVLDAIIVDCDTEILINLDGGPIEFKALVNQQPFHALVMPIRES